MNHEQLEKIRALLAKAEATSFAAEAELFTAKAQELMQKWSIDEAMLHQDKPDPTIDQSYIWIDANEYRSPKLRILQEIASVNDATLVMFPQGYREVDGERKRQFKVAVIGTKTDRDFIEILYTSLMLQVEHELLKSDTLAKMQFECEQPGHRIRWRNSFVNAYAFSVGQRMQEAKKRAVEQVKREQHATSSSMALVLVGKKQQVERKRDEFYPSLRKGRSSNCGNGHTGSASSLGYEAGKRADIGNPKVKAGSTKRIGA